jgi:hypothetical protein
MTVEERRRKKRLAKLDKKIKQASKRQTKDRPIKMEQPSLIKNK